MLVKSSEEHPKSVSRVMNRNNGNTEWFQITLGKDKKRAQEAKRGFNKLLQTYGSVALTKDAEQKFENEFVTLVDKYATDGETPPEEGSTSSKPVAPAKPAAAKPKAGSSDSNDTRRSSERLKAKTAS
ncbi:hypothetical protein H0H92_015581 [Tricholoma furcatifolium]|nr:hypothetical protein H0H92_015581 [Tricholoma furcatifolium]